MRARGWCFTINNYTSLDQSRLMDQEYMQYRYLIAGFEKGEKGTPHIQGYVYFDNQRWFKSVAKLFNGRAHIEPQKGSFEQATEYCIGDCDDDYVEYGDKPHPGKVDRERIDEIMKNPWANFHLYNQYKGAYAQLVNREVQEKERKIIPISEFEKYNETKDKEVCMYPSEYDGEDIVVFPCYADSWVLDWINGHPQKYKVGYEIRKIDPSIVYITFSSPKEYASIVNKYIDYL